MPELAASKLAAINKALIACGAQSPTFPLPHLAEWFLTALRDAGFDVVESLAAPPQ